jgi:hypothetical protein
MGAIELQAELPEIEGLDQPDLIGWAEYSFDSVFVRIANAIGIEYHSKN